MGTRQTRHHRPRRNRRGKELHRVRAGSGRVYAPHGYRALYVRVPRLIHQLGIARADGSYVSELARLARFDALVLDDSLSAPMKDSEKRDLREVLEDR